MNRRPEHMLTYAGMHVFPGGRVEPSDWSETMLSLIRGVSPRQAQEVLDCDLAPHLCLGYWVAAVRELFEEVGIHFFLDRQGTRIRTTKAGVLNGNLAQKRLELQHGKLAFPQLLDSEALHCDVGRLSYFFHRITPEHYSTRFDTRFYLAALPSEQEPLHASEEVAESVWISPKDALLRNQSKNFPMAPPTVAVLSTLAEQPSWEALQQTYRIG
jgi:8-oxo-dGTP pyrophosphatase MutT (NUDIX family)